MNQVIPQHAKWAFTTRNVDRSLISGIDSDVKKAVSGDLVLAEIIELGSHKRIQLASGRTSLSHNGDIVVLCCGDRYAPDQYEGIAEISEGQADLLAGGGVIGKKRYAHGSMSKPTQLRPIGLLTFDDNSIMNIANFALSPSTTTRSLKVIAVTGTAMNSGKTTSAFSLVNGLSKLGKKVAALKVTGTGAFGDFNAFKDAGASIVLDFTDAGMATTYQQPVERIVEGALNIIAYAAESGSDVAVVELGDGILQQEAWQLLNHPAFKKAVDKVLFAAPDALSAIAGLQFLNKTDLPIAGVTGLLTRSPLLCSEYQQVVNVPIFSKEQLSSPETARSLIESTVEFIHSNAIASVPMQAA